MKQLRPFRFLMLLSMLSTAGWGAACSSDGGGSDDTGPDASTGEVDLCHPLAEVSCMMPWPSNLYLEEDAATATGYRVALPASVMPTNNNDITIDPTLWNLLDGFSPSGSILAAFEGGVSAEGLPGSSNIGRSIESDSPILLINLDTGERWPFLAETDLNITDPTERSLIIRPMKRLDLGARYAVAIRDSVKAADGSNLNRSAAFEALLNGESVDHPLWERIAPGYEGIFAAVENEGVSRDELVLAWEFTTASLDSLTSDMLSMRDQAMPAMGVAAANLSYQAEVLPNTTNEHVFQVIGGTFEAPNFLSNGEDDESHIVRDSEGLPVLDGTYTANFSAIIPQCAQTAELPLPVMVFGHGLFGTAEEYLTDGFLQEVSNEYCMIVVGTDWIGLSGRQLADAARAANDLNRANPLTDKLGQAVVNFIALQELSRAKLVNEPLLARDGTPMIDPEQVFYLGASLGGIMGGTFMAYDPHIERGVLGVPGGAWSILIERSFAWSPLQGAAMNAYEDPYDYQLLVALLAMRFERFDPIATASNVIADPLPGTPAKQLMLYQAMNDSLVNNLSTETLARSLEVDIAGPSVSEPWGLELNEAPLTSGLLILDDKVSAPTDSNVPPPSDNGTHSGINSRPALLRSIEQFFFDGNIANECRSGDTVVPCDCSTGACQ